MLLFLLFALLLLFVITSAFLGFVITRVPFVPTYASDIKFIIDKLKISSADVFYDLGSGNGKVCFLVEKLSGAKTKGFEQTLWTHWWAKIRLVIEDFRFKMRHQNHGESPSKRIKFSNHNFFNQNWSEANIIYCYLYPPLMQRIEDKFKAEMKPGSIAIVRDFPFPKMAHAEKYYLPKEHEIYVYRI
jgi:hypothetical protein